MLKEDQKKIASFAVDTLVLVSCGTFLFFLLCVALYLGIPAALIYFIAHMGLGETVVNYPRDCFDLDRNCQVVNVQHSFSSLQCVDSFTYDWTLSKSPVVYRQVEQIFRELNGTECPTLDIGPANATFLAGTNTCFILKEKFSEFASYFSCGSVVSLNDGVKGTCQALLPPSSNFDPALSRGLGITSTVLLVVCCALLCKCYKDGVEDGKEEKEVLEEGGSIGMKAKWLKAPTSFGTWGSGGNV